MSAINLVVAGNQAGETEHMIYLFFAQASFG